jgi:hypothetical protein
VRERRQNVIVPNAKNITYLERRDKAYPINASVRIQKYHKGEIILRESYKGISKFYLKILQNSGIIVDQRVRNMVLNLTVLSFNYSRPKLWLQAPWWKII